MKMTKKTRVRKYTAAQKKRALERKRAWYQKNLEKVREYNRKWHREWKKKNPERSKELNRLSYMRTRRHVRRAEWMGDRRCVFCEIMMKSRTVKLRQRRYCDSCKNDPKCKSYLRNLYMRRYRQKKNGEPVEEITLHRLKYKGHGRPPKKTVVFYKDDNFT